MDEEVQIDLDAQHGPDRLDRPEDSEGGSNWRLVGLLVVTAVLVGYFVIDGLGSQTYFFTVDEAVAEGDDLDGREVRIKGEVVDGSIEGGSGSVGRRFEIADSGETLEIHYDRALPDTFKEGVQVVATGRLTADRQFQARKVLVKCPSRYEGQPPTGQKKGAKRPGPSTPGS